MKSGRWKSHIILLKIKRLSGRPVSYTHLKVSIEVAIEQHDTETTIPYLHVFLDNMWDLKHCAFVRLDKPEYVPEKNSIRSVSYTHLDLTVVNFWGTFCNPCINEMPELAKWNEEMPDNVQMLGAIVDVETVDSDEYALAQQIRCV